MRRRPGSLWLPLAALALSAAVLPGCAIRTPAPQSPEPAAAPRPVLSPLGSRYTVRVLGSGFAADITLQATVPDTSSAIPVSAGAYIDSSKDNGGANKLVIDKVPVTIEAATSDGATQSVSAAPNSTMTRGATRDVVFDDLALPASTTTVTITLHMGKTAGDAAAGTTVSVPVSAIPVVASLESANRTGASPAF